MRLHPIASALGRNKTGLILIALQVALTLAIVVNSLFIIVQRLNNMGRPSGLDEQNTFTLRNVPFVAAREPDLAGLATDMAALRAMPGVLDATASNSVPLSNGGWSTGASKKQPDPSGAGKPDANTAVFLVDEHGLQTFGMNLVAGRNFTPDELLPLVPNRPYEPTAVIVSQALATKLFPDGNALGQTIWAMTQKQPQTIVGIVERLQSAWPRWKDTEHALLAPGLVTDERYVVRTQPGQLNAVLRDVEARLRGVNDQRVIHEVKDLGLLRADAYRRDRAMAIMLVSVIVALLTITGLGIVGMASFWVTSRTKQIGTRRALGARRRDVTRYFQLENLMITGVGLAVGALLAYGFNLWLMQQYELPRLAWYYVPLGGLALCALGQLAVLGPALRGAGVPPAVATRSV
jgi:putative ABC transport system permease protein